jgi:hypothetical protein
VPAGEWVDALAAELARDGRQPELAEQTAVRMLKRILGRTAGWPWNSYVRSDGAEEEEEEEEDTPTPPSSWLWGRQGRPGR